MGMYLSFRFHTTKAYLPLLALYLKLQDKHFQLALRFSQVLVLNNEWIAFLYAYIGKAACCDRFCIHIVMIMLMPTKLHLSKPLWPWQGPAKPLMHNWVLFYKWASPAFFWESIPRFFLKQITFANILIRALWRHVFCRRFNKHVFFSWIFWIFLEDIFWLL